MAGTFSAIDGDHATFVLPNDSHAGRAREWVDELVAGLEAAIGRRLVITCVGETAPPSAPSTEDELGNAADFEDMVEGSTAVDSSSSFATSMILDAFPGATEVH
jgi:hypothetical protein